MSNVPTDLHYTKSHEWVRRTEDGSVEIGITDHAQSALGDLVYVELPDIGRELRIGDACAVVESVKAASDVYSPVAGKVTLSNGALAEAPELLNQDPYGRGWLFRLAGAPPDAAHAAAAPGGAAPLMSTPPLMDAAAYERFLQDESH